MSVFDVIRKTHCIMSQLLVHAQQLNFPAGRSAQLSLRRCLRIGRLFSATQRIWQNLFTEKLSLSAECSALLSLPWCIHIGRLFSTIWQKEFYYVFVPDNRLFYYHGYRLFSTVVTHGCGTSITPYHIWAHPLFFAMRLKLVCTWCLCALTALQYDLCRGQSSF